MVQPSTRLFTLQRLSRIVKAVVSGIKEALGIKAYLQHPNHLQQAFAFGKNLGSQAHVFAQGCLELDADVNAAYGLHLDLGLCGQEGPASAPAVGLSQHDGIRNAARLESIEPGTSSQPGTSSKAVMPLSMDVEAPEEGEEVEDMVAEARRQMRHVGEQPGVARPLSRLEGFQRSDDGEFSLAPNLRREVHRVHRNLGHPGNEVFVRALQNAGVRDHIIEWTKKAFQMPHIRC